MQETAIKVTRLSQRVLSQLDRATIDALTMLYRSRYNTRALKTYGAFMTVTHVYATPDSNGPGGKMTVANFQASSYRSTDGLRIAFGLLLEKADGVRIVPARQRHCLPCPGVPGLICHARQHCTQHCMLMLQSLPARVITKGSGKCMAFQSCTPCMQPTKTQAALTGSAGSLQDILECGAHMTRTQFADPLLITGTMVQLSAEAAWSYAMGVGQCDGKPDNIVYTKRGITTIDFGFADGLPSSNTEAKTYAGTTGNFLWAPPEQARGELAASTDIFAFGACGLEMDLGFPKWALWPTTAFKAQLRLAQAQLKGTAQSFGKLQDDKHLSYACALQPA